MQGGEVGRVLFDSLLDDELRLPAGEVGYVGLDRQLAGEFGAVTGEEAWSRRAPRPGARKRWWAKLAGAFPELEDELCALTYAGFEGVSDSPDRADAVVWAMSELFETRPEPRIRRL